MAAEVATVAEAGDDNRPRDVFPAVRRCENVEKEMEKPYAASEVEFL
jgi:hypothetical protein